LPKSLQGEKWLRDFSSRLRYKIYLAPCGMGLGHAARMLSAGLRLKSRFDVVYSTYGLAADFIEKFGFKVYREPPVHYSVFSDGEVDTKATILSGVGNIANFLRQVQMEAENIASEKPNLIISDSRLSTLIASKLHNLRTLLVCNQLKVEIPIKKITFLKSFFKKISEEYLAKILFTGWYMADRILIPDLPPPYTISKYTIGNEAMNSKKVRFIGPLLMKWPENYPHKEAIKSRMGLSGKKVVLLSLSGSLRERESMLYRVLETLKKCDRNDIVIIASRGKVGGRNVVKKDRTIIFDWIRDKYLFLKASDVVITHGGHTSILEAIVFGVPSINIPAKTHTERFLNSLAAQELGVGLLSDVNDLCWAISRILDTEDLEKRLSEIRRKTRLRGDVEIYKIVEQMLSK